MDIKAMERVMPALQPVARRLGRPLHELLGCVALETGGRFSTSICNAVVPVDGKMVQRAVEWRDLPAGSRVVAVGLIQWTRVALAEHLRLTGEALSFGTVAQMTPGEQAELMTEYFEPHRARIGRLEDLYLAILYPEAIGKPDGHRVFVSPSKAYELNRGLDRDRDGDVEVGEICRVVRQWHQRVLERWQPCYDRVPPECPVREGDGG